MGLTLYQRDHCHLCDLALDELAKARAPDFESVFIDGDDALEARELIKLSALKSAPLTAAEACTQLAQATGAEAVFSIGNRFVLYRQSKEHRRIYLD